MAPATTSGTSRDEGIGERCLRDDDRCEKEETTDKPFRVQQADANPQNPSSKDYLSTERFALLSYIHPNTKRALNNGFGFDFLTKVQAAAMPYACQGFDVLAKARTGTGKTLAFLIPMVERVCANRNARSNDIKGLVLSPTRELALQTHGECALLMQYHPTMRCAVVYGGTNIRSEVSALQGTIDILTATPGRLIDHTDNTSGFVDKLRGVTTLTLDEADRMLEMGFRPSIDKILKCLKTSHEGRQTLLFSATVPNDLVKVAPEVLSEEFWLVDTLAGTAVRATNASTTRQQRTRGRESDSQRVEALRSDAPVKLKADDPVASVAEVIQEYVVTSFSDQILTVFHLLDAERKLNHADYKIMVFFTTARLTQLFAELFNAMGITTLEIHSRKSQSARMKASEAFRVAKRVTLFSSDVSARGMDYPGVTYVLQVGLPASAEQYLHRLGRTARAGKMGRGTLLLSDFECFFLQQLRHLPLHDATSQTMRELTAERDKISACVRDGLAHTGRDIKGMAYAAWLGYYNSSKVKWTKAELVREANYFATECLGLPSPPPLMSKTIGKMGLKGVPGLVVESRRTAVRPRVESEGSGDEDGDGYRGDEQKQNPARREYQHNLGGGQWGQRSNPPPPPAQASRGAPRDYSHFEDPYACSYDGVPFRERAPPSIKFVQDYRRRQGAAAPPR